jgi:DNA polymerase-3 subunit epsilon
MRAVDLSVTPDQSTNPIAGTQGRKLVFDTETTGLGADHRVVEIGVVEIVNRRPTGREFHVYLNPERSIDADAERIHGLSARFLADKPKFREIANDFIEFLGSDGDLVAHNATFDVNKLNAEFEHIGSSFRINTAFQIIDTMKVARKMWPGQSATMDRVCARLNVSTTEREVSGLHGALFDARILTRMFLAMTAGQVHFGYSEGRQAIAASGIKLDRSRIGKLRVIQPSAIEEIAHAKLCDAIEKSSGGYCGFRGKWTKPEKAEPAKVETPAFGAGTVPAAPAAAQRSPAAVVLRPEPTTSSPTSAPAMERGTAEIEFAPEI